MGILLLNLFIAEITIVAEIRNSSLDTTPTLNFENRHKQFIVGSKHSKIDHRNQSRNSKANHDHTKLSVSLFNVDCRCCTVPTFGVDVRFWCSMSIFGFRFRVWFPILSRVGRRRNTPRWQQAQKTILAPS